MGEAYMHDCSVRILVQPLWESRFLGFLLVTVHSPSNSSAGRDCFVLQVAALVVQEIAERNLVT